MVQGIGLVFAGGYDKGAHSIGVWKALQEFGIAQKITAVAGVSVGAFHAALFVQEDYYAAERIWLNIENNQVVNVGLGKLLEAAIDGILQKDVSLLNHFFQTGFGGEMFTRQGLDGLIHKNIELEGFGNSPLVFFAAAYNPRKKAIEHFNINTEPPSRIREILLSAAAYSLISGKNEDSGECLIDGGSVGHVPIKPLYDIGVRNFVVISDGKDITIYRDGFADANIIEIAPSIWEDPAEENNPDSRRKKAMRQIELGYADAMRILQPIYETGLVQAKIASALQTFHGEEAKFENINTDTRRKPIIRAFSGI